MTKIQGILGCNSARTSIEWIDCETISEYENIYLTDGLMTLHFRKGAGVLNFLDSVYRMTIICKIVEGKFRAMGVIPVTSRMKHYDNIPEEDNSVYDYIEITNISDTDKNTLLNDFTSERMANIIEKYKIY
tara:strand:- start:572 stop:964 length:393 start_codon:yes stop_codon:yes gene_type:complete